MRRPKRQHPAIIPHAVACIDQPDCSIAAPSGDGVFMQDRATESNKRSMSGAHFVNPWPQKSYCGFLISSIKVMSKPHGCGLFTRSRSSSTLVTCSCNTSCGKKGVEALALKSGVPVSRDVSEPHMTIRIREERN